ncbi:hypothetical protein G7Y31_06625 [Corynebacterium lizhenjunii]|uniref:Uncharacterized protein n=1 Tax=Corynebacterium lizhenjunii TaxID=2709394 RepID=A0A7T0KE43_9CORY|nr:hypothetical protein [Corynebacterium lizhenjunii]QPK78259.1 hypothetical protein G7Y31_06625 [Corynebacterium lizhenjunii]
MDLRQWRKHIDQVVADEGQWLGILDEFGLPLYELGGVVDVSFPQARLEAESVAVTLAVTPGDRVVNDLVGAGLGVQDAAGRLVPAAGPTRLIMLARAGKPRQVATVTHTVASGSTGPATLVVHGVGLVDSLSWWPCPSVPVEWASARFDEWTTDAGGVAYKTPRQLAQLPFATRADGYTVTGRARRVVQNIIQDSFDAVNALYGWADNPHAVVDFATRADKSPQALVRVNDDPVLDTVAETCRAAGLGIGVSLWWPGDGSIYTRTRRDPATYVGKFFAHPVLVVRVREIKEA